MFMVILECETLELGVAKLVWKSGFGPSSGGRLGPKQILTWIKYLSNTIAIYLNDRNGWRFPTTKFSSISLAEIVFTENQPNLGLNWPFSARARAKFFYTDFGMATFGPSA